MEYYGVASTPTEDFLAHYGVRGMKWGVRKAIEKGNDKRLWRHYTKAQKKLNKLTRDANISVQKGKEHKHDLIAKKYAKLGLTGAGTALGGATGYLFASRPKANTPILQKITEAATYGGAGAALIGAVGHGINKTKADLARERQTLAGHKEAVAKRDAWQKEMKSAFKGTKYANKLNEPDYAVEYYKRNKRRIDKREAKREAAYRKNPSKYLRRFNQKFD